MQSLYTDQRYTVSCEPCDNSQARYVVRFSGSFVASCTTKGAALLLAMGESARRRGCLVVEAVEL